MNKEELINDKSEDKPKLVESKPERLAESQAGEVKKELQQTPNDAEEHREEGKVRAETDVIKQLSEQVASFDRKVESLGKFKLELYQELHALDSSCNISDTIDKVDSRDKNHL